MTKYREIIRLTSLGFTQRNIMAICGVAQKTVVKVQRRAKELRVLKTFLQLVRINLLILIQKQNQLTHKISMASQEVPTIIGGKHL